MNYNDYNDDELIMLINESSEEAKDILYNKYHYIIDIIFKKYYKAALLLNVEPTDLFQEAMLGFTDAINCYKDDKLTSFATFASLCIERKLQGVLKKASRIKNKIVSESVSLEYEYDDEGLTLKDLISDDSSVDPLLTITDNEVILDLERQIKEALSDNEYAVYQLMIQGFNYHEIAKIVNKADKQVDNTMQRIRNKVKKIINKE